MNSRIGLRLLLQRDANHPFKKKGEDRMPKIVPHLWYDKEAGEAAELGLSRILCKLS